MPVFLYKNININYTSTGQGGVIVLLHGFLENISMWKNIIPILSKKNRIIAIDLLGHGDTGNLGYIHSMEDQAEMIKSLLSSLKLRKFTLIGHSMGGYIALAFADLYPNSTKGFCLMNSTSYADSEEKKINRDRAIIAVKQNHKTFIKVSIPQLFSIENRKKLKSEIKLATNECLKTSKQGVIASLEGMKTRIDRTHILQNSNLNILLILGENDPVLDVDIHLKQVNNIKVKTAILPHGHMSHIESKNELIKTLDDFVKS
ncbi:alpha/beta fold hydrolase [Urechidicola croceus]|uniref:Alpha/beta hydrolase n=1 Tax=Urechidicola croceus TaxID=1850246 RepID=A0A1D8P9S9_9FLAO|nr:alpha/beta hydrolase [Urechidicola croceus]AOW21350.1 alpha/beta hydrolase [Urechidicola croceus]